MILAWRHPKPLGVQGLCLGRCDARVDPRKAKRLAHRIRAFARSQGLPPVVHTSPLERCAAVGRWLERWGWEHRLDDDLLELDFGAWDARPWAAPAPKPARGRVHAPGGVLDERGLATIPRAAVDAWCADLLDAVPHGGESVRSLLDRVQRWMWSGDAALPRLAVTHGGWISAARWLRASRGAEVSPATWPAAPRYGGLLRLA